MLRALLIALLVACSSPASGGAQAGSLFAAEPAARTRLPDELREISGLATAPDGRLFAHDDEHALIYQLEAASGAIVSRFSLGDPVLAGDFEGLAIAPDGGFYLTTSAGEVYAFREGADGAHVSYQRYETDLSSICEIEGLAYLADANALIFACKRVYREGRERMAGSPLRIWSIGASATSPWSPVSADLAEAAGVRHFRPSGVEIDPASGRVLVISANDPALVELDRNGAVIAARALQRHPQPEGVAVLPDGALIISDEGAGGRPRLTRYARTP